MRKAPSSNLFCWLNYQKWQANSTSIQTLWHHKGHRDLKLGTLSEVFSSLLLPPFQNSTNRHQLEQKQKKKKRCRSCKQWEKRYVECLKVFWATRRCWISCKRCQRGYLAVGPHGVPSSSPAGSWVRWAPQREQCSLDIFLIEHKHTKKRCVTSKPCVCVWSCRHLDIWLLTVVGVNHDRGRHVKTFSLFPQCVHGSRQDSLSPACSLTPDCQTLSN